MKIAIAAAFLMTALGASASAGSFDTAMEIITSEKSLSRRQLSPPVAAAAAAPAGLTKIPSDVELADGSDFVQFGHDLLTPAADCDIYGIPPSTSPTAPSSVDIAFGGIAEIGEAAENYIDLVYVIDVSGSTVANHQKCTKADINRDGLGDQIIDCEILSLVDLNEFAINSGIVQNVRLVRFSAKAERLPAAACIAPDADTWTSPLTPGNGDLGSKGWSNSPNGIPDIEDLFVDSRSGGLTNYEAATEEACAAVNEFKGDNEKAIIFMSDGESTTGGNTFLPLSEACGAVPIYTFAVGAAASCPNQGKVGVSLEQVSAASNGGYCTQVKSLSDLPSLISSTIKAIPLITKVEVTVDPPPVAISDLTYVPKTLPVSGPGVLEYSGTFTIDAPGEYKICSEVFATSRDDKASVQDCRIVLATGILLEPKNSTVALTGDPDQEFPVNASYTLSEKPKECKKEFNKLEVTYTIPSGPNELTAFISPTTAGSVKPFTYDAKQGGAGVGTDNIEGCIMAKNGNVCDTAVVNWIIAATGGPTPLPTPGPTPGPSPAPTPGPVSAPTSTPVINTQPEPTCDKTEEEVVKECEKCEVVCYMPQYPEPKTFTTETTTDNSDIGPTSKEILGAIADLYTFMEEQQKFFKAQISLLQEHIHNVTVSVQAQDSKLNETQQGHESLLYAIVALQSGHDLTPPDLTSQDLQDHLSNLFNIPASGDTKVIHHFPQSAMVSDAENDITSLLSSSQGSTFHAAVGVVLLLSVASAFIFILMKQRLPDVPKRKKDNETAVTGYGSCAED